MRCTLCLLVAACGAAPDPPSTYELTVRGAVVATARGSVDPGPAGTAEEPYYTITLGGPDGQAAVVFTRAGPVPPPLGVYPVGDTALGVDGFSAQVITGMPSHPTGVFRVLAGRLTITAATPDLLAGYFDLRGIGFLTESPQQDGREIQAAGRFTTSMTDRATALSRGMSPSPAPPASRRSAVHGLP